MKKEPFGSFFFVVDKLLLKQAKSAPYTLCPGVRKRLTLFNAPTT